MACRRDSAQRSSSVCAFAGGSGLAVDSVRVGVQDVEAVRVPQLEQELPHGLGDRVERGPVAVPGLLGREQVPAQRVGPVAVDHLLRRDRVPERLRHLAALVVEDQAEAHHVSVGRAVEQQRRDGDQRVEPAARLVERLADEVGGEVLLEQLRALVGGVVLRERHRARVEPDVDHLGNATHRLSALGAWERRVVDERAMGVGELGPGQPVELGERADRAGVALLAAPHGERRAPVALARQGPVDVVLEPVAEAPVLDVLGGPVDGLVGGEETVLDLARRDVPGGLGVVEQRRVATPAVRIGVLVRLGSEQAPALAEVLDQIGIAVLDLPAGVLADPVVVGAVEADRVDYVQAILLAEAEVVLAERDRRMDEPGAVVGGDEVAQQDGVAARSIGGAGDEREWRVVRDPFELPSGEAVEDVRACPFAENPLYERFGEDVNVALVLDADVVEVWVDRHSRVRDQRPRSRGPDQQLIAGMRRIVAVRDREAHVNGRVDHVLIHARLPELVAGERHLVAGAVRNDLELLVQQALVVNGLERPPDRFDVLGVQRAVGVVEVDPEPDPLGHRVPVLDVAEDLLAAASIEFRDPESLDVVLGGEPELGFQRELYRQPVAVPAALALDGVAAHRPVARKDVLEHAREHVVEARRAVGGRRAFVEPPARGVAPAPDRLGEHVALAPAFEHALLELGKRDTRIDGAVSHGHGRPILGAPARMFASAGVCTIRAACA